MRRSVVTVLGVPFTHGWVDNPGSMSGAAVDALLQGPTGFAVDAASRLVYMTDGNAVRRHRGRQQ